MQAHSQPAAPAQEAPADKPNEQITEKAQCADAEHGGNDDIETQK